MKTKSKKRVSSDKYEVQEKVLRIHNWMNECLIERHDEIDMVMTSLFCEENPLFVGPPGTAKSMLASCLMKAIDTGKPESKFDILLTKYTMPEEIFGPFSLQSLKADIFRRVTNRKLPEATVAFVDEIFKASSAILNTLLRILNERTFNDGLSDRQCPLKICIAASNEFPNEDGGKELGAVFDRFLLRKKVLPIRTKAGKQRLLWGKGELKDPPVCLEEEDFEQIRDLVSDVRWTDDTMELANTIIADLNKEGIFPGDRRLRKSIKAVKAHAFLSGSDEIVPEHLMILAHCLWEDPTEQPEKCYNIVVRHCNPEMLVINEKTIQINSIVNDVEASGFETKKTTESISKLRDILKVLEKSSHPQAEALSDVCQMEVARLFRKITGHEEDED